MLPLLSDGKKKKKMRREEELVFPSSILSPHTLSLLSQSPSSLCVPIPPRSLFSQMGRRKRK
jgi:hypothetical protein